MRPFIKNLKLSKKIVLSTAISLILVFTLLLSFTVNYARAVIEEKVNSEFSLLAKSNGTAIENAIQSARSLNTDVSIYVSKKMSEDPDEEATPNSLIYRSTEVSSTVVASEEYFLNTFWSALINSNELVGASAIFDDYAIDDDIEHYTVYVTSEEAASSDFTAIYDDSFMQSSYYTVPMETSQPYISTPYTYEGEVIITYSSPVIIDNKTVGVLATDISLDKLKELAELNENYPSMQVAITDANGIYIMNTADDSTMGTSYIETIMDAKEIETLTANAATNEEFSQVIGDKTVYFHPMQIGDFTMWLQNSVDTADLFKDVTMLTLAMIGVSTALLIILLIIISLIVNRLMAPMKSIVSAAGEISSGSFDTRLDVKSNDEIGQLSKTFNNMSDTLSALISEIEELLYQMSKNNFDLHVSDEALYVGSFNNIRKSFIKISSSISKTITSIKDASEQVNTGSALVASGALSLSNGTTSQASSIDQLQASVEGISDSVTENANRAKEADALAYETQSVVISSAKEMENLVAAISDIQRASKNIENIIKTIDDIAFQTNILALNAAVEAARAGQAGKGFAVVADEVRNLAQKSSDAVQSTSKLINESLVAVNNGTKFAQATTETFAKVEKTSTELLTQISSIAKECETQASNLSEVTIGIRQIATVVQSTSATGEESAAASDELSRQSENLNELVARFKLSDKH